MKIDALRVAPGLFMKESNSLNKKVIEQLLAHVEKPARYIGGEWHQIKKDPDQIKIKLALAFPDVYEIGMSYLGFQLLYEVINQQPFFSAERCYSPWQDMEKLLRNKSLPLFTLETYSPLVDMDVIAITLQHEMSYSNILNLLDLGQIPLERKLRQDHHPLVIGGGPGVINPEPIEPVFDLFVLGDGEVVILEILNYLKENATSTRQDKIRYLATLPGIYAPQYYHPIYNTQGQLERITAEDFVANPVHRCVDPTIAAPTKPLVPFLAPIHDRLTSQLFRGCTRGCRFCQAGMTNRPLREQDPKVVVDHIKKALATTGYEEASLTSLSSGDYSQILPVVRSLMNYCVDNDVALSLPSLRLDSFRSELAQSINQVRKTGLTFAPEAGSQRLRQVINKELNEEEFITSLAQVFNEGWDLVKLYFMIGLPTETEDDIQAINQLVSNIIKAAKQAKQGHKKKRSPRVNLGVNLFIPKAQTPFQWEPQLDRETAKARLTYLANHLPKAAGFGLGKRTDEELNRSYLEAVLARGDRRLWPVIKTAWQLGAKFDSWGDLFNFQIWSEAFSQHQINPDDYACRLRSTEECLPWDHLDYGVNKSFLKKELEKSRQAQVTPDCCRENKCQVCGARDPKQCPLPPISALPADTAMPTKRQRAERPSFRMRLSYQKKDCSRFVGHLDMVNAWRRATKRAKLPVHYSQGFHPQPSMGFGPPLPLGYFGLQEWMDIGLEEACDPEQLLQDLNLVVPDGLKALTAQSVELNAPSLNQIINGGHYQIVINDHGNKRSELARRLQTFWNSEIVPVQQWSKKGPVTVNARTGVHDLKLNHDQSIESKIRIDLLHESGQPRTVKVPTIVAYLCQDIIELESIEIIRSTVGQIKQNELLLPSKFITR